MLRVILGVVDPVTGWVYFFTQSLSMIFLHGKYDNGSGQYRWLRLCSIFPDKLCNILDMLFIS